MGGGEMFYESVQMISSGHIRSVYIGIRVNIENERSGDFHEKGYQEIGSGRGSVFGFRLPDGGVRHEYQ